MKRYKVNFLFLFIALIATSCFSLHDGNISSNVVESNFTYRETAMGQASSIIILGFGGSKKYDLVNKAKRNLESNRFLAPNERYINYIIDKQTTIYFGGLVIRQAFTVHADVIAINQESDNPMSRKFKENYLSLSSEGLKMIGPIAIGQYWHFVKQNDSVYLADGTKAFINDFNKREATIFYIEGNTSKKKVVDTSEIFFAIDFKKLDVISGDTLESDKDTDHSNAKGQFIAISNKKKILVKNEDGNYMVKDLKSKL